MTGAWESISLHHHIAGVYWITTMAQRCCCFTSRGPLFTLKSGRARIFIHSTSCFRHIYLFVYIRSCGGCVTPSLWAAFDCKGNGHKPAKRAKWRATRYEDNDTSLTAPLFCSNHVDATCAWGLS